MRKPAKVLRRMFLWLLAPAFGIIFIASGLQAAEDLVYDSHGRRDPFVPLVSATSKQVAGLVGVESAEDLQIEGIVYDPKKGSIVIANGTVLREGEEAGPVKVIQIRPNEVIFTINGQEASRSIYQEESKRK